MEELFQETKPIKLSRSKLELFMQCKRCFYLDIKLGIKQVSSPPYTINNAIDILLKKEFDYYRAIQKPHPIFREFNLEHVLPYAHAEVINWRSQSKGIRYLFEKQNIELYGVIDDVWQYNERELIIVDYKATGKKDVVTKLSESGFVSQYKRQLDIYAFLFKKNNFLVSSTGYFVYTSALSDVKMFHNKLYFVTHLIPYTLSTSWVEKSINDVRLLLDQSHIPSYTDTCTFCEYNRKQSELL